MGLASWAPMAVFILAVQSQGPASVSAAMSLEPAEQDVPFFRIDL